jgi:hypothetical protein
MSGERMVALVQRETRAVRHRSSEDLQFHSRDLESIFLPQRVECIDGVLQVMVPRTVPARQHLPSNIGYCLSTGRMRGGTCMLADHLLPVEDLHSAGELHAPWPENTIGLVLQGLCDTQLKQQTMKLCEHSWGLLTVRVEL